MKQNFFSVLEKAKTSSALTPEDLVTLLSATEEQIPQLMAAADAVRLQTVGNQVHLRGIIEFSSYCSQRCCYCGLRADNKKIQRYRLTPEQILDTAQAAVETGYRTLVLQSGEDTLFSEKCIAELTTEIKKMGVAVTLSCGERSYETYQLWREAGADPIFNQTGNSRPGFIPLPASRPYLAAAPAMPALAKRTGISGRLRLYDRLARANRGNTGAGSAADERNAYRHERNGTIHPPSRNAIEAKSYR